MVTDTSNALNSLLSEKIKENGFEVSSNEHGFFIKSKPVPTDDQLQSVFKLLTFDEHICFWNYYHRTISDPGAYVSAYVNNGQAFVKEGNHGWSGDYMRIELSDLSELIIRNWVKHWGKPKEYNNCIYVEQMYNDPHIRDIAKCVDKMFVANYEITAEIGSSKLTERFRKRDDILDWNSVGRVVPEYKTDADGKKYGLITIFANVQTELPVNPKECFNCNGEKVDKWMFAVDIVKGMNKQTRTNELDYNEALQKLNEYILYSDEKRIVIKRLNEIQVGLVFE